MNKTVLILLFSMVQLGQVCAQGKYIARQGQVTFFSYTSVENIEASNNQVFSIVDIEKEALAVSMLMRAFVFKKALMQEHFNENYMESGKYPKSTFQGSFEVPAGLKAMEDGSYELDVAGELLIHGVKQDMTTKATLMVSGGTLSGEVVFKVKVKDYEIKIPKVVVRNIAEEVEVTGVFEYQPYKK